MITGWTCLASLSFVGWLFLLLGRHGFWRARPRLETSGNLPVEPPAVAAVVPARDEADVIETAVSSLLAQDYPGQLDIVVVDDGSSDGTAGIVEGLMPDPSGRRRLCVIRNTTRPSGWSGKLWAVRAGLDHLKASGHAAPVLLLTDADIAHHRESLSSLIEKMVNERRDLVSLMVRLRAESLWERLLIPPFVFFFQMLYPFDAVNDPDNPTAAAAGGCVLLRRQTLDDAGGIEAIKGALIDDVALGRLIKQRPAGNRRIWLGLARRTTSIRAYQTLASIWAMVARTADTQLGHSLVKLSGTVLGPALLYLLPPLLVLAWPLHQEAWLGLLGLFGWAAMSLAFWPTLKLYEQPAWQVLTLPIAAMLYTAMTIDSARLHRQGQGGLWKGRVFVD